MVKTEAVDLEPPVIKFVNSDIKQTSTELIALNGNQEIQYQGYCKLQINIISKFLKVNPVNEDFLDITATFDWKFIKQKNIIFVFAKHVSQDFLLVFKDEEKCQKVFNGIFKKRENSDSVDKEELQERFLIPIFKKIPQNGLSRLKVLMKKWIRKHDNEIEKKEYFKLLKEHQNKNIQKGMNNVKEEIICKPEICRKRRHHQMENYRVDNDNMDSSFHENFENELNGEDELLRFSTLKSNIFSFGGDTKIIDESKFKIVNVQHQGFIRRKLLMFTSDEKSHCYEFNFYPTKNIFLHLCNAQKRIKAILVPDENGNDCIEYENKKHVCSPILYDPEKYMEIKIVKKADYKIIENYPTESKRRLIIFDSNDRSLCYEYYWESTNKKFLCCACVIKNNKNTSAEIIHENSEKECIQLLNVSNQKKHVCFPIKISTIINSNTVILENSGLSFEKESKAEEFDESRIVRLPNFELRRNKNGIPDRKLIVFNEKDRKTCYVYHYQKSVSVYFVCNECLVSAVLKTDGKNGENFVYLGENEHKCKPVKYDGSEIKIIEETDYMIFNKDDESKPTKLIIFTSSTKEFCYEYSFLQYEKKFQCCACLKKERKKITAKLLQNSNGEESIQLSKIDHLCEPKKFVLEEFQPKTVSESEFKLCSNKNGRPNSKLIVFDSEKDGFCYEYSLEKPLFRCIHCNNKKKRVTTKLCEKENGEKYLELSSTEHICKSTKYDPKMLLEKVMDVLL